MYDIYSTSSRDLAQAISAKLAPLINAGLESAMRIGHTDSADDEQKREIRMENLRHLVLGSLTSITEVALVEGVNERTAELVDTKALMKVQMLLRPSYYPEHADAYKPTERCPAWVPPLFKESSQS